MNHRSWLILVLLTQISCTDTSDVYSVEKEAATENATATEDVNATDAVSVAEDVTVVEQETASAGGRDPIPDFSQYKDVKETKLAFFGFLSPLVKTVNDQIWTERLWIVENRQGLIDGKLDSSQEATLVGLLNRYSVDVPEKLADADVEKLLERVDVVPASLILAQAANESAWGTSRFALEGRNFFGIWCYSPGCGLTPSRRDAGAKHEVRVFDSVQDGVAYYAHMINTGSAYQRLRTLRANSRAESTKPTGVELAAGLIRYSQRGQAYVDEIRAMIRQNGLSKYLIDRANLDAGNY